MGTQRYVNEAQQYLKVANKGIKASEYRCDLQERDNEIAALKDQLTQQRAIIDGLVKKNDAANLVAAETALAGSMGRPQHMPHAKFDAQAAQIAALGAQTRPGKKVAPKRKRPQLEE